MARIPRMIIRGEPAVYHVVSRTALEGFVLGDAEKNQLLKLIRRLSAVYFAEVLGFCLMGDHFHLVVRIHPNSEYSDEEIRRRFRLRYEGEMEKDLEDSEISDLRLKWESLAEYGKDLRQVFARWYNKTHKRRGFFWGERFRSVITGPGDALVNCLAYIDLNPVRAGLVMRPEEYPWCTLGWYAQFGTKGRFPSLDLGLEGSRKMKKRDALEYYRDFVHRAGEISPQDHKESHPKSSQGEEKADTPQRFLTRTRYFTDSGVLGSKEFVARCSELFDHHFTSRHPKRPKRIAGLDGVYSLKRLTESK